MSAGVGVRRRLFSYVMIKLEHISYWYPENRDPAVCDLSLEIGAGESVCVMGRNGSGKSTLVKLIAGFVKPTRGQLEVKGEFENPGSPAIHDNEVGSPTIHGGEKIGPVGIIFQNPDNQMVATLVEKEIAFALENRAVPLDEMKTAVQITARQFGIEHLLKRLTTELSGGEKQRVALASVMVQQPQVLLLDEPDSYLDQAGRLLLETELNRLHDQNSALIELRITQSVEAARKYQRLIVLDQGAVVADDTPDEILAKTDIGLRSGLLVPDLTMVNLALPETLEGRHGPDGSRVAEVSLSTVDFNWPMGEPILRQLNLSWSAGETVGLVGHTGSGKSSLSMLLAGLVEPTAGDRHYRDSNGVDLETDRIRGQVALVLQQPERQFFLDTCAEEIAFGPSNMGRALPAGEIDKYFTMVGLNPARYAERDPFTLSAGEKRRLAFAAVLSMAPSMVIFDEPTAGLDGEGVGRFMALSRRLREAGLGQLIISHDGDVMTSLADRILYLNGQSELIPLTPETLVADPNFAGLVSRPSVL